MSTDNGFSSIKSHVSPTKLRPEPGKLVARLHLYWLNKRLYLSLSVRTIGRHILFWAGYVFFKTYLNITADSSTLIPESAMDMTKYLMLVAAQLAFLVVKVPLVYTSFFFIDRYLEGKWNRIVTISFFVLLFSCAVLCMTLLNHYVVLPVIFSYEGSTSRLFAMNSLLYHFFTLAFVAGAACSLKLLRKQYHSRLRESELQKERTENELKYLKGQINPHFLFNTLNNIYSLARKKSEQTPEAVMKLSKLMRFMLYEASNSQILLTDELKLIEDYIALEKLRYDNRLTVSFATSIDNKNQRIAPLLLIHFVENAFKHGASESRFESVISIQVSLNNNLLTAKISNTKEENAATEKKPHIGLENIKRQLELLYPGHTLNLANEPDHFNVDLTILLSN